MQKFVLYNNEQADRFVKEQNRLGNDVRWEGWDLVFFRPAAAAESSVNSYSSRAVYRNGRFGFEYTLSPSPNSSRNGPRWEVDYRNVRRLRPNRTG